MFLPENIDLANSEKYRLSIRLSPNGFSFYFHSSENPDIFHFQKTDLSNKLSYIDNIKKIIFDQGFFCSPFNKTTVILVSPHYTIVPKPYFDERKSKDIMDFNFHNLKGTILHNSSESDKLSVLFNMDEDVHSFLTRHLSNPEFKHHTSSLLCFFNTYKQKENQKKCFVDFHDGFVSIYSYLEDKLLSALTFPANSKQDITYYIASIWEKQSFDQTKDCLYLCGEIDSHLSVINDLKRLINNVERVELKPKAKISAEEMRVLPTDVIASLCV